MSNNFRSKQQTNNKSSEDDVEFLLKTIDEQNDKISRIEKRFKDLTNGYKSLLAEKKALEITLKALKTSTPAPSGAATTTTTTNRDDNESLKSSTMDAKSTVASSGDSTATTELTIAEDKIKTLTENIQLILETKANMEQSYLNERKKLKTELDDLKSQLIVEHSRSTKADDNSSLLNEENQRVLVALRNENNDLKSKLKNLKKQFDNKCEEVIQCEKELKNLKTSHEQLIKDDEQLINQLTEQLKESNSSHEKRVNELELQISKMCLTITDYENSNSSKNQKLSNMLNLNLNSSQHHRDDDVFDESQLDFNSAIKKISRLKKYVESMARDLNISFDFNELWPKNQQPRDDQLLIDQLEKLKEENKSLNSELEKYKIKTANLIKQQSHHHHHQQQQSTTTTSPADDEKSKEIDLLKKQIKSLERENNETLNSLKKLNDEEMEKIRDEFKEKFKNCENSKLKIISELEKELVNQRERTLKLIAEKDAQLLIYQQKETNNNNNSPNNNNNTNKFKSSSSETTAEQEQHHFEEKDNSDSTVNNNGYLSSATSSPSKQNNSSGNNNHRAMMFYDQENTVQKDVELSKLRMAKNDLEYKLKQALDEQSVDQDRYETQLGVLKREIERLKLMQSRAELNNGGTNLEYIKNVIFNFITTKDNNVKLAMINAIMHILQFSKSERLKIQSITNHV